MDVNHGPPAGSGGHIRGVLLDSLLDHLRRCAHRLGVAADRLHRGAAGSAARRTVLQALDHGGPQTVPEIARDWSVSRQHIQTVVNELLEDGLVDRIPNPVHRRSHLVRLTAAGEGEVEATARREAALLSELDLEIPQVDLEAALRVLTRLRSALDDRVRDTRV